MSASSLIEVVRRQVSPGASAASLHAALWGRLTDPCDPRGVCHPLSSLASVLMAGVACGYTSPLAIAEAAAGWGQEALAGHGCWRSPRSGLFVAPSTSTLPRLPALLDAEEREATLAAWLAPVALDQRRTIPATDPAVSGRGDTKRRRRKPPAAQALRETRADGWVRAAPGHPWRDPTLTADPGHVPARPTVAVDGTQRKGAKTGGKTKVHLLMHRFDRRPPTEAEADHYATTTAANPAAHTN